MTTRTLSLFAVIALSCVGVLGDVFLKKASQQDNWFGSSYFFVGFVIYSSTAFGWILAMRYLEIATIGAVYSVATIILLAVAGMVFFNERLTISELIGIALALCSLALLSRHA